MGKQVYTKQVLLWNRRVVLHMVKAAFKQLNKDKPHKREETFQRFKLLCRDRHFDAVSGYIKLKGQDAFVLAEDYFRWDNGTK